MKDFYVYGYLRSKDSANGPSGSFYYIGKGKGCRAYRKHDSVQPPADVSRILIIATAMFEWDAFQAEMLLIYMYGRSDLGCGVLRNLTDGGDGSSGRVLSEESKDKIRNSLSGRKVPPERVLKQIAGQTGRTLSEETRIKIGNANRCRERTANELDNLKRLHARRSGSMASDETRKKISESLKAAWKIRKEMLPNMAA